jgi:hypothetical protein
MAQRGQQGTGKHGHKDTEEPYPHHEASQGRGSSGGHSGQQEGKQSRASEGSSRSQGSDDGGSRSGSDNSDLKQREYRDAKGEVHHHTKTYMEQHGKSEDRKS